MLFQGTYGVGIADTPGLRRNCNITERIINVDYGRILYQIKGAGNGMEKNVLLIENTRKGHWLMLKALSIITVLAILATLGILFSGTGSESL